MTVATAPSAAVGHLGDEIRQSQAALLYADSVTLISPRANLIQSLASVEDASDLDVLPLLAQVAPTYAPQATAQLEELLQLVREVPPRSQVSGPQRRARRARLEELTDFIRPATTQMKERFREKLSEVEYYELDLAIQAGLLSIDPLPGTEIGLVGDQPDEDVAVRYFARVKDALTSGATYPLFDPTTSNLVARGVEAGVFTPVPAARRRGRDAALATGLFDQLPNFEYATMSEVLDIREELRDPLQRFRQGVREISKDIETVPEDPHFGLEVEEAWTTNVAPALLEIENAIRENSSMLDLLQRGIHDPAAHMGIVGGAGIALAVGPASGISSAVSLLVGGTASLTGLAVAAVRAELAQRVDARKATEAQFYFLYGANARIGVSS